MTNQYKNDRSINEIVLKAIDQMVMHIREELMPDAKMFMIYFSLLFESFHFPFLCSEGTRWPSNSSTTICKSSLPRHPLI